MKNKLLKVIIAPVLALSALAFSVASFNVPEKEPEVTYAWSGTQTCSVQASYYSTCENLYGDELAAAIRGCNQATNLYYKDWSRYERADEAENDSTSILSLYTRHTIPKSNHVSNSYSWNLWNREHIFTQTAFPASSEDTHNIYACEGKINQIRGNDKFGEISGNQTVSVEGHDTGCKSIEGSKFEPCDAAKGEVARACLYVSVMYPDYKLTDIFESVAICLKWHAEHPVTDREIYRNNKVHTFQGNRNPFVDHPSYANKIYSGYTQYTQPDPIDGKAPSSGPKVTSIALDKTTAYVAVNGTLTLTVSFNPTDAANKGYEVMNSNYEVLAYTKSGTTITVTGRKEGAAKIIVKSNDGNFEASCDIIVNKDGKPSQSSDNNNNDDDMLFGCGGSIIASSVLISTTSLIGLTLLLIKRKKEE